MEIDLIGEDPKPSVVVSLKEKRRQFGKYGLCHCMHVTSDPETELIECDYCGRFFTGYQWFRHIFSGKWRLEWKFTELREDVERLQAEKDALVKEVGYLKRKKKLNTTTQTSREEQSDEESK